LTKPQSIVDFQQQTTPDDADGTGAYVWNGLRWESLSDQTSSLASSVRVHVDQDRNQFYSGDFVDAGRWMLYNLRTRKYADGTPLPASPSLGFTVDEPMWLYPMPDGGDGMDNKLKIDIR
jgi:hypothetical protein